MKAYEITGETLAIFPVEGKQSKVIETEAEYLVEQTPFEIISNSCMYFGCSYEGRQKGSKKLTGSIYKTPIIVEETRELIFFPTTSPKDNECCWINAKGIEGIHRADVYSKTKVELKNGEEYTVDISYPSFHNQMLRSTHLESRLRDRKLSI